MTFGNISILRRWSNTASCSCFPGTKADSVHKKTCPRCAVPRERPKRGRCVKKIIGFRLAKIKRNQTKASPKMSIVINLSSIGRSFCRVIAEEMPAKRILQSNIRYDREPLCPTMLTSIHRQSVNHKLIQIACMAHLGPIRDVSGIHTIFTTFWAIPWIRIYLAVTHSAPTLHG